MPLRCSSRTLIRLTKLALVASTLALNLNAQRGSGGGDYGSGRMDPDMGMPSIRLMPVLIFYPPNPPPLGRAIAPATTAPQRNAAPPELAAYLNEIFYPPLSTRLVTKSLSKKLQTQLEQYRANKLALQTELRAELDRLRDADPATRINGLSALAQRQAARLAELEKAAEQLRRDLIDADNTWTAQRQWRLGDNDRRGFSPFEIAQVMRGYAFYQNGLLPAQRRLLREIALELMMAADNTASAEAAQPYIFFPPEPARVLLPDDMPDDVAAKLAAYQTKKSLLKKQLYDAVYAHDGQKLSFFHNTLKTLAEQQAGPLAELETMAEEIRRGLTSTRDASQIAEQSPLPPLLHSRVAALMANYTQLQRETSEQVEAILASAKGLPMQATYRFEGDGLKYLVIPTRVGRGYGGTPNQEVLNQILEVRTRIGNVANDYGQRVVQMIAEKDAIRAEVAQTLGGARAVSVDNALMAAMRVATAKETEGMYREYRLAVFQPGMSPEQRRLLFDAVMERLDLPLPPGELQPTYRGNSW